MLSYSRFVEVVAINLRTNSWTGMRLLWIRSNAEDPVEEASHYGPRSCCRFAIRKGETLEQRTQVVL